MYQNGRMKFLFLQLSTENINAYVNPLWPLEQLQVDNLQPGPTAMAGQPKHWDSPSPTQSYNKPVNLQSLMQFLPISLWFKSYSRSNGKFFFSIFLMTSSGSFLNWRRGDIDCHLREEQSNQLLIAQACTTNYRPVPQYTSGYNCKAPHNYILQKRTAVRHWVKNWFKHSSQSERTYV